MVAFGTIEGTFKNKALVWLGLAILLVIGITLHGSLFSGNFYWVPVYATEFATFLAISIALLKPKSLTGFVAFVTSTLWLINQFSDAMAYWGMMEPIYEIFVFTAIINTFLLTVSLVYAFKTRSPTMLGTSSKMFLTFSMFMMLIYAGLKTYIDFFQAGGLTGVTWALSGGIWALGILMISLATLMSVHISERRKWSLSTMITLIGFLLSMIAALAWGLALTVY